LVDVLKLGGEKVWAAEENEFDFVL